MTFSNRFISINKALTKVMVKIRSLQKAEQQGKLLALPRELRDEIFAFAYTNQTQTSIISNWTWAELEKDRKSEEKRRFQPRSLGECPLLGLVINKQYFYEATEAWFKHNELHFATVYDVDWFWTTSTYSMAQFVSHISIDWKYSWRSRPPTLFSIPLCSNLKRLKLTISEDAIFDYVDCFPSEDDMDAEDFQRLPVVRHILSLRSLKSLQIHPGTSQGDLTWDHRKLVQWQTNIEHMEEYISRVVQMPKHDDYDDLAVFVMEEWGFRRKSLWYILRDCCHPLSSKLSGNTILSAFSAVGRALPGFVVWSWNEAWIMILLALATIVVITSLMSAMLGF